MRIVCHNFVELDAPFSEEKVWKTITLLSSDKAHGTDGFTGRFVAGMKGDIMAAFSAVWSRKLLILLI
jgi:hypothetical protein